MFHARAFIFGGCIYFVCLSHPFGMQFFCVCVHGTAPSACTVLLKVTPLRGDNMPAGWVAGGMGWGWGAGLPARCRRSMWRWYGLGCWVAGKMPALLHRWMCLPCCPGATDRPCCISACRLRRAYRCTCACVSSTRVPCPITKNPRINMWLFCP